uniref:Uncharacterized protein n=1 Tax=viral metagenome TaxID=1070528 RepID=A0A6C0AR72_9ZZZZ
MSRRLKRNGLIEPSPKNTVLDHKIEDVIVENKRMTITTYVYEWSIDIFIGSQTIYCAYAHLSKMAKGAIYHRAFLHKIRWDEECSEPFQHGKDTAMIFNLIMTYIKKNYPAVTIVEFNDVSNRKCDNGAYVNLAAMKLFTDGQTWYESHFKAKINDQSESMYRSMLASANLTKQHMSWDTAKNTMPWSILEIDEEELKEKYNSASTWTEWFKWIRTTIGDSAFCIWLSNKGWFDEFQRSVLRFNIMSFIFQVNVADFDLHYNIKKGGKRKVGTQKKRH